jgi:hypothetical protein
MKDIWKSTSAVVLSTMIAFALTALDLQARVAGGQFKLPFDAKWGEVALPTGGYTFSIDHIASNGVFTIYRGSQALGFVRPEMLDDKENRSQSATLVCIRHDRKLTVRALRLPHRGTFYFPITKELSALVAQQPQLIETVSISVSGE